MKKRFTAFILAIILMLGINVVANANSITVSISDANSFKSTNLSGNTLIFDAGAFAAVQYNITYEALSDFHYDSDIKYYTFKHGNFSVRVDKNGYFDFGINGIRFTVSNCLFNAEFVKTDNTYMPIIKTKTENRYTVYDSSITELFTAKVNDTIVSCKDNKNGVLIFDTQLLGTVTIFEFKFEDVSDINKWYYSYINKAGAYGIMNGMGENKFEPQTNITRAQLATMLVRVTEDLISFDINENIKFDDVKNETWFSEYVLKCASAGLMIGRESTKFEPTQNATRQEIATVIARTLRILGTHGGAALPVIDDSTYQNELANIFKDSSKIQNWAKKDVLFCHKLGIMVGDSEGFRPLDKITRAECAKIFWLVYSENV